MTDQRPVISPWRTDFENAPSPCIGWCTPPAGDDVRQIWRHSHLKGQWTAHSITQAVKAWQPMPSIDGSTAADLSAYIPDIVKNAMLTMWNYICDDSKHHPLDIEHGRGKLLTFEPKHWAQFTGEMVQRNIRDLFAPQPVGVAQCSRPRDFLSWAIEMFGPVAKLRSERLLRFVEEAIELAHAEGMEREVFNRVADRVYSRPAGDTPKEIGQVQACLETFAENIGLSSAEEAQREFERVQSIPQEEWTRRHSAKQAIGIAISSTEPLPPDWKQDQAETSRLAPRVPSTGGGTAA